MMTLRALVLSAALLALTGCASQRGDPGASLSPGAGGGQRILVTLDQGSEVSTALLGPPGEGYRHRRGYAAAPGVERTLRQLAREHGIARVEGWPIASLDVYCGVFEVGSGVELDGLLRRLEDDPRVGLAQRVNTFETLTRRYDDTYADLQASVLDLGVGSAHELATGQGVTVAVVDSGVDARHPEFRGRVALSRDFVDGAPMARDGEVHGTAVAGVIASAANNREGIVGMAPEVSLAALRACRPGRRGGAHAQCSTVSLARALDMVIELSPNVLNLSLSGPRDPLLSRLLGRVVEHDIVVVTAGPEGSETVEGFPWAEPGVIVARSPDRQGAELEMRYVLGAPAHEILTTTPAADYAFLSGSSLAAAHVSGIAALLMERNPRLGTERLARLLAETATLHDGRPMVNACRAVASLADLDMCGHSAGVVNARSE